MVTTYTHTHIHTDRVGENESSLNAIRFFTIHFSLLFNIKYVFNVVRAYVSKYWLSPPKRWAYRTTMSAVAPASAPAAIWEWVFVCVFCFSSRFDIWVGVRFVCVCMPNDWQQTLYFRIASIYMTREENEKRDVELTLLMQFIHFFYPTTFTTSSRSLDLIYIWCLLLLLCFFFKRFDLFIYTAAGTFKNAIGNIDNAFRFRSTGLNTICLIIIKWQWWWWWWRRFFFYWIY